MTSGFSRFRASSVLLGAAVLLLAAIVVDSTVGLDARACSLCHAEQLEAAASGAHAQASCLSCHLEAGPWSLPGFKVDQWTRMYPRQISGRTARPSTGVSRSACVSCHPDSSLEAVVERNNLRILHPSCAPPEGRCDSCHGATGHGSAVRWPRQVVMEECIVCHTERRAPQECDTCHQGRVETERLRVGPWRTTHGAQWRSLHAMGTYEWCATCHVETFCAKCHGVQIPHPASFGSTHGSAALLPSASCEGCHTTPGYCDDCHGVEMPHPTGFLTVHNESITGLEDERCLSCHSAGGCRECHTRHDAHPDAAAMEAFRRRP